MDEPSSALSKNEASVLFNLKKLAADGCAILYISHKLEEVIEICSEATISGEIVNLSCGGKINKIDIPWITEQMVGKRSFESVNNTKTKIGNKIIEAKSIFLKKSKSDEYLLDNISFDSKSGEILSFYGLMGSGRTEILEIIMGLIKDFDGSIYLENNQLKHTSISKRISNGIVLVPEDRQGQGLVQCLSVSSNTLLSKISKNFRDFFLNLFIISLEMSSGKSFVNPSEFNKI